MENHIEFIKGVSPFNTLPDDVLIDVVNLLHEHSFDKDTYIYHQDQTELSSIDILMEGQYDAFFYDNENRKRLEEHYSKGAVYGGGSVLLNKKVSIRTVLAHQGTKVLCLDREEFKALCRTYESFFHYFTHQFAEKMMNDEYAHFVKRNNTREENFLDSDRIFSRKIDSIKPRELVTCSLDYPIYLAARLFRDKHVNCIYIEHNTKIIGFITKDILTNKVIAENYDLNSSVEPIVERRLISISRNAFLHEALFKMEINKIEFILVESETGYEGYISKFRLMTEHAQSPIVFIQSVKLSVSVDELKQKWGMVPEMVNQLLTRGVNPEVVNQIVTTISDAILQRVIIGTLDSMPHPPAKFAFMVLGSEGRMEQTLVTDQDNAIIYEDKANEQRELVREYFLNFAEIVSEKLDYIGFSFCKGGFMAKNPKWTHSLSHWKGNYDSWMNQSIPETVINITTFFDCRFIYGDESLINELRDYLDEAIENPTSRFIHNLASNSVRHEPSLTLFRGIRTFEKDNRKVLDLKKEMAPIVELVRMYALKHRLNETNTGKRIHALYSAGHISELQFKELTHAYYYLMGLRLRMQARSIIDDFSEPSNLIEPDKLTIVEQATLVEIFKVIKNFQGQIRLLFHIM